MFPDLSPKLNTKFTEQALNEYKLVAIQNGQNILPVKYPLIDNGSANLNNYIANDIARKLREFNVTTLVRKHLRTGNNGCKTYFWKIVPTIAIDSTQIKDGIITTSI